MRRILLTMLAATTLHLVAAGHATAGLIFEDSGFNNYTFNDGTESPVAFVSAVAQDTPITNIGVESELFPGVSIRFLVYNLTTKTLEYGSDPVSFPNGDSSVTWKESASFSDTLRKGDQYLIGAVANGQNYVPYNFPGGDVTQNGITTSPENGNFTYNLTLINQVAVSIPLRLYNTPAVPEPSSLALVGLGSLGLGILVRRRARG